MNEALMWTGLGWGLAVGLAVALVVTLSALRALWRRTQGPQPPREDGQQDAGDVKFPNFGRRVSP